MGNFKEIGQTIVKFAKTEATGVSFDLQRNNYQGAVKRVLVGIPHDFKSVINELQNSGAQHHFSYEKIIDRRQRIDLIDPGYGSLRMMLVNFYLERRSKNDIEGKKIARFHYKHQDALINAVSSLTDSQSLAVLLPHGLDVNDGVAAAIFTNKSGKIEAYSRLLPEMNEQQAMDLFSHLAETGGQTINLGDNENDSALWTGVMTESNDLDFIKNKEVFDDFLTGIFGQDFLKGKVTRCLDGGSCSSSAGQAVTPELKPVVAVSLAGAGGGMGGGGGGSGSTEIISANGFPEKEASMLPVLSAPALFLAASLPTSAALITQPVAAEVLFATALHKQSFSANNTVANDHGNPDGNPVSPVLLEPVPLVSAAEQSLRETEKPFFAAPAVAEPLFISDLALQFVHTIPVALKAEPASVFPSQSKLEISQIASIIEEKLETVKLVVREESVQVQKAFAPMIQLMEQKPVADKPVNLATVKAQVENKQVTVGREVSKTEEAWQAETENMVIGATPTEQAFTVNQLRMTEQQVVSEKAVKELSLPLLEIAAEKAPLMVLRVALKPIVKTDEVDNFEMGMVVAVKNEKATDDEVTFIANDLQTPEEKKIIVEIDQEKGKLFLVENFSVASAEAVKTEKTPDLQIKKLVWRITAESKPADVSLLELELPKDQNQRLYAFYHFLQKVVKKVVGQDAIRTRQIAVMVEKEDVDLNLELVDEIKYYLELLKSRGRSHAQAFAFAD